MLPKLRICSRGHSAKSSLESKQGTAGILALPEDLVKKTGVVLFVDILRLASVLKPITICPMCGSKKLIGSAMGGFNIRTEPITVASLTTSLWEMWREVL